jgi:hypothetical protein
MNDDRPSAGKLSVNEKPERRAEQCLQIELVGWGNRLPAFWLNVV